MGTGKPRSKFGEWADANVGSMKRLMEICKIDKNTATSVCDPNGHKPNQSTRMRIIVGLQNAGYYVEESDFW